MTTKEVTKKKDFKEIEDKLNKMVVSFIYEIERPLQELIEKDLPEFAKDKLNGEHISESFKMMFSQKIEEFKFFFTFIQRNISNFKTHFKE